jgi:hypothetical protein
MWHKSPSAAATDYVKDSVEDLAQGVHSRASGSSGDRQMRLYVCSHSASERSVWYALLISCPASYRASASGPLFRQFLECVFSEVEHSPGPMLYTPLDHAAGCGSIHSEFTAL